MKILSYFVFLGFKKLLFLLFPSNSLVTSLKSTSKLQIGDIKQNHTTNTQDIVATDT
jgi:hypothetical protein